MAGCAAVGPGGELEKGRTCPPPHTHTPGGEREKGHAPPPTHTPYYSVVRGLGYTWWEQPFESIPTPFPPQLGWERRDWSPNLPAWDEVWNRAPHRIQVWIGGDFQPQGLSGGWPPPRAAPPFPADDAVGGPSRAVLHRHVPVEVQPQHQQLRPGAALKGEDSQAL